jgi:hypothetical protein
VAQVLQRLPRQLLRSSRTSGLLEETRLSLLKERLYGRIKRIEGLASRVKGGSRLPEPKPKSNSSLLTIR